MKPSRIVPSLVAAGIAVVAACHGKAAFPYQHRDAALECPATPKPEGERSVRSPDAGVPPVADETWCSYDSDCSKGKNGRCVSHGHMASHCGYDECATDADCKDGKVCACDHDGNSCVSANCHTDADCGGRGCSPAYGHSCNGFSTLWGYYCHTAKDSCTDDSDCSGSTSHCIYSSEDARWVCVDAGRCVG